MRIHHCHSLASLNVLNDHIEQHGCLAHTGFPHHIKMAPSIIALDAKPSPLIAKIGFGKICYVIVIGLLNHNKTLFSQLPSVSICFSVAFPSFWLLITNFQFLLIPDSCFLVFSLFLANC